MAAGSESSAAAKEANLLYPELMSAATIVKILKERYVKHPRLEELDKAALVQLYEKTVLPLPQREYRDTRMGRALAALRERADSRRKRKASTDASSGPPSTKQQRKLSTSSEPSTSQAREPPPNESREGKSGSAERERQAQQRLHVSGGKRESSTKSERASAHHINERASTSADPTQRTSHDKPGTAEENRRQSQPNKSAYMSSSKQDKNAGTAATNDSDKWGSWDDEPKSSTGKTSATNRCHGEGDGPPRKKHRTPITWP